MTEIKINVHVMADHFGIVREDKYRSCGSLVGKILKRDYRGEDDMLTCSYCGSVHPDYILQNKGTIVFEPADRKYGYQHKYYLDGIPNPRAGVRTQMGSESYFDKETNKRIKKPIYGNEAKDLFAKFYTEHIADNMPSGYRAELIDFIWFKTGLKFVVFDLDTIDKQGTQLYKFVGHISGEYGSDVSDREEKFIKGYLDSHLTADFKEARGWKEGTEIKIVEAFTNRNTYRITYANSSTN